MEKYVNLKNKKRMSELKFIFGKPREGVHKWRRPFLDVAAVDLGLTLMLFCYLALL